MGQTLFEALFSSELATLYDRSLEKVIADHHGLRLLLKIDPACPDTSRLHSLPWELLFRPRKQDFVTLNRRSPLVRLIDVPELPPPPPAASRLRVLVLLASPKDLPPLDLARERTKIERALRRQSGLETEFLEDPTLASLRRRLLEGDYHALHFMGHGGFAPETGDGVLFFTGEDGLARPIRGQALAQTLHDFESVRLVVLNACETAKTPSAEGLNPFAGVATALLLAGIPAVVAMQFPISDQAAIAFGETFYRRLAAGDPVDAAVSEGRQAIHADPDSWEWVTPVLFASAPGLRIYRPQAAPRPKPPRRWLAAAVLTLLLAAGALWMASTPVAEATVELDLEVSKVAFTLAERQPVIDRLPLQGLAVSDLAEVRLPAAARRESSLPPTSGGRGRTLILSADDPAPDTASITLEETFLPAASRVLLAITGEREALLALEGIEDPLSLALEGAVSVRLPPAPPQGLTLTSPGALVVRARRPETDLHLTLFSPQGEELHSGLEVEAISFLEIEETVDLETTRTEEVSTIRSGSLVLGKAEPRPLEEREKLRFEGSRGSLSLALHDDHIAVRFRGRVTGVTTEPEGSPRESLMPTLLAAWGLPAYAVLAALVAGIAALLRMADLMLQIRRLFHRRPGKAPGRSNTYPEPTKEMS